MTLAFARRDASLTEIMDGPCDEARLFATYRHFELANRVISGWRRLYLRRMRPVLATGPARLLDIGFGGGDIPRALARWADADGFHLDVTAIDPDERAMRFAQEADPGGAVRYLAASSGELRAAGERFDVVVSNHVLHHLAPDEFDGLLSDSTGFGARLVIHDDIERSRLAYAAWAVGALPFALDSFALVDGLRSIRRSYTADELAALAPGWRVERAFPWRVLLVREPPVVEERAKRASPVVEERAKRASRNDRHPLARFETPPLAAPQRSGFETAPQRSGFETAPQRSERP